MLRPRRVPRSDAPQPGPFDPAALPGIEERTRIVMPNTFGGNRLPLGLHRRESRVAEINQTAAILLRGEVDARGGEAVVAEMANG